MEKEYVIYRYEGGGMGTVAVRIVKKESELTREDRDLFLADTINSFNRMPDQQKMEFMLKIYQQQQ